MFLIKIIILILLLRLCYKFFYQYKTYKNNKKINNYFKIYDKNSDKKVINDFIKSCDESDPLDQYRVATVYDYVLKQPEIAAEKYMKSLTQLKKGHDSSDFIITKIRDRLNLNNLYTFERKDVAPINTRTIHNIRRMIEENPIPKDVIKNPPKWTSDSQNVHDSNINKELVKFYDKIRKSEDFWSPKNIINYLESMKLDKIEQENLFKAKQVLEKIDKSDSTIMVLDNIPESVFVSNIFNHIETEPDDKKRKVLFDNFINNLKDSNENGMVCLNGRISRIMSSLNTTGFNDASDDDIGNFKSVQMIKQEIYSKVGAKRNEVIDKLPEEIQTKYNNSDTNTVSSVNSKIIKEVDKILDEYKEAHQSLNLHELKSEIEESL